MGALPPYPRDISGKRKQGTRAMDADMRETVRSLIDAELRAPSDPVAADELRAALVEPEAIEVQFSGAVMVTCWTVTGRKGPYRVIYMPEAGYFSLCVEGPFGPLDIGVHGEAVKCFASV